MTREIIVCGQLGIGILHNRLSIVLNVPSNKAVYLHSITGPVLFNYHFAQWQDCIKYLLVGLLFLKSSNLYYSISLFNNQKWISPFGCLTLLMYRHSVSTGFILVIIWCPSQRMTIADQHFNRIYFLHFEVKLTLFLSYVKIILL